MNPIKQFEAKNNPFHTKGFVARGSRQLSGKTAAKKAEIKKMEAQDAAKRDSEAFALSQKKAQDRLSKESSDKRRAGRRSGSRRSLLTGDERGVEDSGRRPVTG